MRLIKLFFVLLIAVGTAVSSQAQSNSALIVRNSTTEPLKVDIYPNPASEFVLVDLGTTVLSNPEIILYNIIGNKMSIPAEKMADNRFKLDIRSIPAGYYLISIQDLDNSNIKNTHKFLKSNR